VPGLAAGLRATVRAAVTDADTAEAMGSGNLPVLATPRLLALAEAATVAAVAPNLTDGLTTVGTAVSLEHRKASPLGAEVVVEAELTEVDGRRLVFGFIARPAHSHAAGADAAGADTDGADADGAKPDGAKAAGSEAAGSEAAGAEAAGAEAAGADADVVVGAGTIERVVVDGARFLARAQANP
jgi:fluoroacetyl-CoA thioesterase